MIRFVTKLFLVFAIFLPLKEVVASTSNEDISRAQITLREALEPTENKPLTKTQEQDVVSPSTLPNEKSKDEVKPSNGSIIDLSKADIDTLKQLVEGQRLELISLKGEQKYLKNLINQLKPEETHFGWVAILLGCVTVIITVLGVVVALVSFIGFRQMKKNVSESAIVTAKKVAAETSKQETINNLESIAKAEIARLLDEGELRDQLESAVDLVIRDKGLKNREAAGFAKYPEIKIEEEEEDEK
jgi:hypothetical protein